jgi:hypothetical protein
VEAGACEEEAGEETVMSLLFKSLCPLCREERPVDSLEPEWAATALAKGRPLQLSSSVCGHDWPASDQDLAKIQRMLAKS